MDESHIKLKAIVPLDFFDTPGIKERLDQYYEELANEIEDRFKTIRSYVYINAKQQYVKIDFDEVFFRFKKYLYKQVLSEAVEMATCIKDSYNLKENVLKILTKQKVRMSIYGEPMLYAFTSIIREIKDCDLPKSLDRDIEIKKLEKMFSIKKSKFK